LNKGLIYTRDASERVFRDGPTILVQRSFFRIYIPCKANWAVWIQLPL